MPQDFIEICFELSRPSSFRICWSFSWAIFLSNQDLSMCSMHVQGELRKFWMISMETFQLSHFIHHQISHSFTIYARIAELSKLVTPLAQNDFFRWTAAADFTSPSSFAIPWDSVKVMFRWIINCNWLLYILKVSPPRWALQNCGSWKLELDSWYLETAG